MTLLVSLALLLPLVVLGKDACKKHRAVFLVFFTLLSIGSIPTSLLWSADPTPWQEWILKLLGGGGLAGAFYILVMVAGALPGGRARKLLLSQRKDLAIYGGILSLGHMLDKGMKRFPALFLTARDLRLFTLLATVLSLLLMILFVPLFVSSFSKIHRWLGGKKWKKLQRLSYAFYALLYLHILFFNLQGAMEGKIPQLANVFLYSLLFLSYLQLRLTRAALQREKEGWLPTLSIGTLLAFGLILLSCTLPVLLSNGTYPATQTSTREQLLPEGVAYVDGTYKGAAVGYNGRLKVSVTIEDGKISEITVKSHVEDEPYITRAKNIFGRMQDQNSPYVDIVSTATTTSEAFILAVEEALIKALPEGVEPKEATEGAEGNQELPKASPTPTKEPSFEDYEEDWWDNY